MTVSTNIPTTLNTASKIEHKRFLIKTPGVPIQR